VATRKRPAAEKDAAPENPDAAIAPETSRPSSRRRDAGAGSGTDGSRGGRSPDDLHQLLQALRALGAGEFDTRVFLDGDPLMTEISEAFNAVARTNGRVMEEALRVSTQVGHDGATNVRVQSGELGGDWARTLGAVNSLISDLVQPTSEIARVLTAVANGDLSQKMVLQIDGKSVQGEFLRIGTTVNTMVDQLSSFASEVTRVAKEVGTEGKLGGQARVEGVAGVWKDLTENVNQLAGNLTTQVRAIKDVTTAVANGDLSQEITIDVKGEILELKNTINTMVDRLSVFADEVTRVAREVGTEGKLGGQARVEGVAGVWKDLTENVNFMAANLTDQVRNIALVTTAVANGDLSQKITVDVHGEVAELKSTINTMVDQLSAFADEVTRVAREVGTEGKLGGQARVEGVAGVWKDLTENVNAMAGNLTVQLRDVSVVATAIANGDLTQKITVDVQGEILQIKNVINSMVDRLGVFAGEVTRVAREVGTEGQLGGQAEVPNVAGTWKDLTENVNAMAGNLTVQLRDVSAVATAIANGDLTRKITVDAQGEILQIKEVINRMVDQLSVFADEATRVAREVGTEGKLGGQAEVPNVAGTWKDLTENVNAMANSLTAQVRAIKDVATAVTTGDLTRTITVEARGELNELKSNVNQMIGNLKETTEKNAEQDWLKTNLAKFSQMMQGQKDLEAVSRLIMSELTPLVGAHHGTFFIMNAPEEGEPVLKLVASYAYRARKSVSNRFDVGEGLVGQAALEKKPILLTSVPDDYIQINSGLGEAPPRNIVVLPVLFEGQVKAVLELASFLPFSAIHQLFLDQLAESVGVVINMISANMRTEELLQQSQKLTEELQSQSQELQKQQEELKRTNTELEAQAKTLKASEEALKEQQEELQQVNEELEEKASLLAEQNRRVEQKNQEVEQARQDLEDKASQLALSSKYKSEFLANMSHELRTPLNSLLILARLLAENAERNLSPKQVEYAQTILGAGSDLLNLINDVLDLSRIEAGKMEIHAGEVLLADVQDHVRRSFAPVAEQKGLDFSIEVESGLPQRIVTDRQRLQQVLKNLLSNAFKFTEHGGVGLKIRQAEPSRRFANPTLNSASRVIAFAVSDTGLGIPRDKQQLIFEAFQQADGTTNRRFGGTGLGLSISREIVLILGGEIRVESKEGEGSTFTLFLPERYSGPDGETVEMEVAARDDRRPVQHQTGTARAAGAPHVTLHDDRGTLEKGDRVVLVIENDPTFARLLMEMAREKGFKGIVALDGETGLDLVNEYQPDAITLDIDLPGMDGWAVLDRLKHQTSTRHIPVHIVSGIDKRQRGLRHGAVSYLEKPVTRESLDVAFDRINRFIDEPVKHLLVVEDDEAQRRSIVELVGGEEDVRVIAVATAEEALERLEGQHFDCMVLDLRLQDMSGFTLLERVKTDPELRDLPIIIYTGKDLSPEEETRLRRYAETIIVKDVKSPERLLDETALFLHRVEAQLPEHKRKMLERLHGSDALFADKKVLIVDDDVRNIFSLTSLLEAQGMQVLFVENGTDAIEMLRANPDIDLVLMDVMMPGMDGYETTRAIREMEGFEALPIIAVTAKAMKGDREKTLAAGASDYVTKPVDTEQLLSLMRVWMYR
jgi:CheY-like chemotaxis protein/signal transduction histidine kinase/HAMP domain-containing protein